jgi:hypothetical protein
LDRKKILNSLQNLKTSTPCVGVLVRIPGAAVRPARQTSPAVSSAWASCSTIRQRRDNECGKRASAFAAMARQRPSAINGRNRWPGTDPDTAIVASEALSRMSVISASCWSNRSAALMSAIRLMCDLAEICRVGV